MFIYDVILHVGSACILCLDCLFEVLSCVCICVFVWIVVYWCAAGILYSIEAWQCIVRLFFHGMYRNLILLAECSSPLGRCQATVHVDNSVYVEILRQL